MDELEILKNHGFNCDHCGKEDSELKIHNISHVLCNNCHEKAHKLEFVLYNLIKTLSLKKLEFIISYALK